MNNRIIPSLLFDDNAEEAVKFYMSVFSDSEILSESRYGDAGPGKKGAIIAMSFRLNGQKFVAINGGPDFKFTPAISFTIECETQEEVDYYWDKLSEGGEMQACGWLRDKYGLSWQVVPNVLPKYLQDRDQEKSGRVMQAMLKMKKLEINELTDAYNK